MSHGWGVQDLKVERLRRCDLDCAGPELPMGWPVTAGASDRYVYVGDALNHRIVRADKKFALDASVDIGK